MLDLFSAAVYNPRMYEMSPGRRKMIEEERAAKAAALREFDFQVQYAVSKGARSIPRIVAMLEVRATKSSVKAALERNKVRTELAGGDDWFQEQLVLRQQAKNFLTRTNGEKQPLVTEKPKLTKGMIVYDTEALNE